MSAEERQKCFNVENQEDNDIIQQNLTASEEKAIRSAISANRMLKDAQSDNRKLHAANQSMKRKIDELESGYAKSAQLAAYYYLYHDEIMQAVHRDLESGQGDRLDREICKDL